MLPFCYFCSRLLRPLWVFCGSIQVLGIFFLFLGLFFLFLFLRKCHWDLIGTTLNQLIALGNMVILTILSPPIHEHSISFHSFGLYLQSLSLKYFIVLNVQIFTFLVKFIPKYFVLFDAAINGTVFLIFFQVVYC